jgi:hypothetical protein
LYFEFSRPWTLQNTISKYLFQDSFQHIFWAMRKMHHTFWEKATFRCPVMFHTIFWMGKDRSKIWILLQKWFQTIVIMLPLPLHHPAPWSTLQHSLHNLSHIQNKGISSHVILQLKHIKIRQADYLSETPPKMMSFSQLHSCKKRHHLWWVSHSNIWSLFHYGFSLCLQREIWKIHRRLLAFECFVANVNFTAWT